jgi:hypothetical protein
VNLSISEKRREVRRPVAGTVRVRCSNPEPLEIRGQLIDVSPSGFRMAHDCLSLAPGQMVEYSRVEATGKAQVMWNRILEDRVETGFFVAGGGA